MKQSNSHLRLNVPSGVGPSLRELKCGRVRKRHCVVATILAQEFHQCTQRKCPSKLVDKHIPFRPCSKIGYIEFKPAAQIAVESGHFCQPAFGSTSNAVWSVFLKQIANKSRRNVGINLDLPLLRALSYHVKGICAIRSSRMEGPNIRFLVQYNLFKKRLFKILEL